MTMTGSTPLPKTTVRFSQQWYVFIIMTISVIGFIGIWWIVAEILHLYYLPTPPAVLDAFIKSFSSDPATGLPMLQQVGSSLGRFITGFLVAVLVAIPVGLLMGFSKIADAASRPIIEFLRPIPPIAWVPLFIVALGFFWGPVMTIFVGVFFPVVSNVIFGVRSVDKPLLDAARTLGASKLTIFRKVVFPYTVPFLMTGITIGLGIGWMCIVAAEMIGAQGGGVGIVIRANSDLGLYNYMFAGMLMIAILGLATVGASRFIERRISAWMGMT
jgi:NitT/TauT family transport system permease protein